MEGTTTPPLLASLLHSFARSGRYPSGQAHLSSARSSPPFQEAGGAGGREKKKKLGGGWVSRGGGNGGRGPADGRADPCGARGGLRRLSTRAAAGPSPASASPRHGLHSFAPLAAAVLGHLRASGVAILPGLTELELARAEAEMGFAFPPDLRAVLAAGLPSGPGFPDWRTRAGLRSAFDLPIAAASLQIARGALWPRCWGPRPGDPDRALRLARSAIRRAPLLVPLFDRCFLPCRPCLAGNPVFFVTDDRVLCCGLDVLHFFTRDSCFQPLDPRAPPLPTPSQQHGEASAAAATPCTRRSLDAACGGAAPRWIEFWSDAASDRRRRDSSSSEASTASSLSSGGASPPPPRRSRTPHWVDTYLDRLGSVLRQGGWRDTEVTEMVEVAASGMFDGGEEAAAPPAADADAVLDALLLKADRCSDSLRRAGWSSEDVSDALGLDLRRCKERPRPALRIPPEIAVKVQRLAKSVARP
ncbi:hypothetical protein HU200_009293 [Digitaria exilis]|uniref:Knr4/Smi1-like domain-containing protein n=1 Tax=Digitaria exilis TaxID=1010633 RepID=A0A835FJD1_9POAL|nr:hypothetical protein HU200_009293 [Digitaria exilis]